MTYIIQMSFLATIRQCDFLQMEVNNISCSDEAKPLWCHHVKQMNLVNKLCNIWMMLHTDYVIHVSAYALFWLVKWPLTQLEIVYYPANPQL